MTHKVLVVFIIVLSLFSCKNNKKDTNFQIDIAIDGVPNGRKAFLKKQVDRKIIVLDTVMIKDGKFSFKGKIKEPLIFGIFIDSIKRGGIFPFVNVNDHVKIIAYKDSLNKSKIEGSKLHDELTQLRVQKENLGKETQKFLPEYKKANEAKDTVTMNRINKLVKKMNNELIDRDWNYVKTHTDSYIAPLVFTGLMANPKFKDSVRIVFNSFSENIKKSDLSKPIKQYFEYLDKLEEKNKEPVVSKPVESPNKK